MRSDYPKSDRKTRLPWACILISWAALVSAPLHADPLAWHRHAFPLPDSIWSVETLDVTGNGHLEVIGLGQTQVFALAAPDWTPQILVDVHEGNMIYCVVLDADRDGDRDIALARSSVPWIRYRQAIAAGREAEEPEGPDFSVAWIENSGHIDVPWRLHVVDRELNGVHGVCSGDVDGDGADDLIADSISGPLFPESMAWFQSPLRKGSEVGTQRHVVTHRGAGGRPHYLDFADLDGDGQGEILLGDSGGGAFTWWARGEDPTKSWTKHVIAEEEGATNIEAVDINGDSKVDVVAACGHGTGIFWFENGHWKKNVIDPDIPDAHALACADFDGDGDTDVAAASFTAFIVRWYENDGSGTFTAHDIDTDHEQQAYDMKAADLDGDGRLDILLAGRESRNVVWYRNEG